MQHYSGDSMDQIVLANDHGGELQFRGRIFSEWFPASGYEHAPLPEIEWCAPGDDMALPDYKSEIWIPVSRK